jgi:hypothetical protein
VLSFCAATERRISCSPPPPAITDCGPGASIAGTLPPESGLERRTPSNARGNAAIARRGLARAGEVIGAPSRCAASPALSAASEVRGVTFEPAKGEAYRSQPARGEGTVASPCGVIPHPMALSAKPSLWCSGRGCRVWLLLDFMVRSSSYPRSSLHARYSNVPPTKIQMQCFEGGVNPSLLATPRVPIRFQPQPVVGARVDAACRHRCSRTGYRRLQTASTARYGQLVRVTASLV